MILLPIILVVVLLSNPEYSDVDRLCIGAVMVLLLLLLSISSTDD